MQALSITFSIPTLYEHSEYVVNYTEEMEPVYGCGSNGVSYEYSVVNGFMLVIVAYIVPLLTLLVNYGAILNFFR